MPQIPTVAAPQLTPPPEMNPSMAGQAGLTIARSANEFQGLAEYGEQETNLLKKAQDEGILLSARNHIEADRQQAETQLRNWTDYTHADELKQQTADTLREKYEEQYGNRPDLWRHIEPLLGQELNHYNAVVDNRTTQLTTDFNQAAVFDSVNMGIQAAAMIPTLAGQQLVWVQKGAEIDAMVRNHSISALEGEKEKERLVTGTIEAKAAIGMNPHNSPEAMQAVLDQLDEYEGKDYVPAVKLAELRDKLVKAKDLAIAHSGKNQLLQSVDTYIMGEAKDPTNIDLGTQQPDWLKIGKKAEDDPNLSPEERRGIREEAEQRDALQKKAIADRNYQQHEKWSPRVEDTQHPLTVQQIGQMEQIPDHTSEQWIAPEVANQLRREAKQFALQQKVGGAEARQEVAYKSATMLRAAEAEPGYFRSEAEVFKSYPGLSKADAKTLFVSKNLAGAKELQDAFKMMNNAPIYPFTNEGNAQLAKDKEALREVVVSRKLTGQAVIDEAQKMITPKVEEQKRSWVKSALDNVWNASIKTSNWERGLVGWSPYIPAGQKQQMMQQRQATDTGGPQPPNIGDVIQGYRFKGGDPADSGNWEKQ